tara:strand:- start:365 stop:520 length:156 start_codon:yes stop_codon:yes gene_type:complete
MDHPIWSFVGVAFCRLILTEERIEAAKKDNPYYMGYFTSIFIFMAIQETSY